MINELDEFLNDEIKEIRKQEIVVDQEIKDRLWKLNETEYNNLKESILNDGCRESLILWNNILIDGHNRFEICKSFGVEYKTIQKQFKSKNDVMKWIDTNQLSRRNITDEQRTILYGRISKINKIDGFKGNRFTNIVVEDKMSATRNQEKAAKELNISAKTLQRAEKYVDAIEDLKKVTSNEVVNNILSGNYNLTKEATIQISKLPENEQKEVINKMIESPNLKAGIIMKHVKKEIQKEERKNDIEINNYFDDYENKIMLGSSVEKLKLIKDNSIDCVIIDPPYLVNYIPSRKTYNADFNDTYNDDNIKMLDDTFKELKRVLKSNGHLYSFFAMTEILWFKPLLQKYFAIKEIPLIWVKNNHTNSGDVDKNYMSTYEPIFYHGGDGTRMLNHTDEMNCSRDVFNFAVPSNKLHNCEKPQELLKYLIQNSTIENEIVLDCFAGSCSTLLAAKTTNRKYIGIEILEENVRIGIERLN